MEYELKQDEIKKMIAEKDEALKKFKIKLASIQQEYGIDFDYKLLKSNTLDTIKFYDLTYKDSIKELSLTYYNDKNYYGIMEYKITDTDDLIENKTKDIYNYLQKNYKLDLIVNEVRNATFMYQNELKNIDEKYSSLDEDLQKELLIRKIEDTN